MSNSSGPSNERTIPIGNIIAMHRITIAPYMALGLTLTEGVRLIPLLTGVTSLTTSFVSGVVPGDVIDSEVTPVGLLRV